MANIQTTITGNPLAFETTTIDAPMGVVANFTPVQEGSGDPSPDNIRPISGWTGCNVYQSGTDYATETESGTITADGTDSTDTGERTPYIKVKTGDIVQANIKNNAAGYRYTRIACYNINKQFISLLYNAVTAANAEKTITETIPNGTAYIRISVSQGTINNCIVMSNYTASWQDTAGTVYGGSLDVAKGLLTVKYGYVDLGSLTWTRVQYQSSFYYFRAPLIGIKLYAHEYDMPNLMCTQYRTVQASTNYLSFGDNRITKFYSNANVMLRDDSYDDATTFKTAMSGVYLCYELATPITYQLTPQQIKSLRGKNNVWSDTNDDISVTYIPYAISRVRLNEEVQIDISDTTATSSDVKAGKLFYTASGVQVSGNVGDGSATMPATSIAVTPSISVSAAGLITATATGSQSVTPTVVPGFISEGTAGTITVSGTNTSQLSTQAAKTVTPTESAQTAVAAGKYTTGAITVAAISSTYVGTGITRRSSTDMTISGTTVTAPAGYYAANATTTIPAGAIDYPVFTTNDGTISNYSVTEETSSIHLDLEGTQDNTYSIAVTPGYVSESVGGQVTTRVVAQLALTAATFNKGTTTVSGTTATRGVMTCSSHGWVGSTSGKAGYFSLEAATFKNAATSGVTYVDISNTTEAPALNGSDLYINQGYVDNLKINFSKLVSSMTLPTAASSTASGTTKATIGRSTSDQYINIPTGYNSAAANYKISAVPNGSATTPATTVTVTPSITVSSAGLITATASGTKSVTPTVSAGYVSSGTAGTITVSGSNTQQLTVYDGSWSIIT